MLRPEGQEEEYPGGDDAMKAAAERFLEKIKDKLTRQQTIEYMFMIVKILLEQGNAPTNIKVMSISHFAHMMLDRPNFTDPNHDVNNCFICDAMHDHILEKLKNGSSES